MHYVSKTGEHILPFDSWAHAATNIQNCNISKNSVSGDEGGIYCEGGTIQNCRISGNSTAEGDGGGVCCCGVGFRYRQLSNYNIFFIEKYYEGRGQNSIIIRNSASV